MPNVPITVIVVAWDWSRVLAGAQLTGPAESLADPAVRHRLCMRVALMTAAERGEAADDYHCGILAGHVQREQLTPEVVAEFRRMHEAREIPIIDHDLSKPHLLN